MEVIILLEVNGSTQLAGIIGNPVDHSLSPLLQNSFFASVGKNAVYVPLKIAAENLEEGIAGLWSLGFIGANVTIPYKEKVAQYLTGISTEAALMGAVNTLVRKENGFWGDNTDGRGFVKALAHRNWSPQNKTAAILGAGGSARAVSVSLAQQGIKKIVIINRDLKKAGEIVKVIGQLGVSAKSMQWNEPLIKRVIAESDLIVNTTPLGMAPNISALPPFDTKVLSRGQFVVDLIYNPLETKLLQEAKGQGCQVENGLGMLIQQGILSFEIWTGQRPLVKDIRNKLEASLLAR